MKKFATFTTMAFLLATAGAFAQTPSTTTPADSKDAKAAKTAKAHKGHKKPGGTKPTTPAPTPAQK